MEEKAQDKHVRAVAYYIKLFKCKPAFSYLRLETLIPRFLLRVDCTQKELSVFYSNSRGLTQCVVAWVWGQHFFLFPKTAFTAFQYPAYKVGSFTPSFLLLPLQRSVQRIARALSLSLSNPFFSHFSAGTRRYGRRKGLNFGAPSGCGSELGGFWVRHCRRETTKCCKLFCPFFTSFCLCLRCQKWNCSWVLAVAFCSLGITFDGCFQCLSSSFRSFCAVHQMLDLLCFTKKSGFLICDEN